MKKYNLLDFHSGIGPALEDIHLGILRPRFVLECGPSDAENSLQQQEATFSNT